jgi:hypothetical protein
MYQVIGTCSQCRGAVTLPQVWGGILPPTPTCSNCGAQPANPHGPVIDMAPPRRYTQDYFAPGVRVIARASTNEGWDG